MHQVKLRDVDPAVGCDGSAPRDLVPECPSVRHHWQAVVLRASGPRDNYCLRHCCKTHQQGWGPASMLAYNSQAAACVHRTRMRITLVHAARLAAVS